LTLNGLPLDNLLQLKSVTLRPRTFEVAENSCRLTFNASKFLANVAKIKKHSKKYDMNIGNNVSLDLSLFGQKMNLGWHRSYTRRQKTRALGDKFSI
jgi:hypothetical protein